MLFTDSAIKGIGEKLVDHIVEEREQKGPFIDFFDFVYRVGKINFISKAEALVKSGALDSIRPNRGAKMLASIPTALKYMQMYNDMSITGQLTCSLKYQIKRKVN